MRTADSSAPEVRRPAVLIVLDGLGDRADTASGGGSPVDAAATPHLDALASRGAFGCAVVVGPGVAPESDAGVFALLGYDPVRDSPGRGVLEALGVEVPLAPEDVALRLNFATIEGDGTIVDARVGRSLSTAEARDLARGLTQADLTAELGVRAEVRATVGHRGVLWLHPTRDGRLSPEISNADPFYQKVGGMGLARRPERPVVENVTPLDDSPEAARTAAVVNRFLAGASERLAGDRVNARRALAGRKIANGLLLRNAGQLSASPVASFTARYGRAGGAVTEMPVERGIARVLGFEDRYVGPMTGDREAGYAERARATRELLDRLSFVYVHLKGPDEPGHDGDATMKREVVEAIDRAFFGPFLEGLDLERVRLVVTADHATPCVLRGHSDDPVPLLYAGGGVPAPTAPAPVKFGDTAAARGPLGLRRGADVLPLLFAEPFAPPPA